MPTGVYARPPVAERFWPNVNKTETCWLWTAYISPSGYGSIGAGRKNVLAHRMAYELLVGPIPAGLTLDHTCRVRHCVNPAHLEPVTQRVNALRGIGPTAENARKTHCIHGHPFNDANTYYKRSHPAQRDCRRCNADRVSAIKRAARKVGPKS